jgi:hypothetical protein
MVTGYLRRQTGGVIAIRSTRFPLTGVVSLKEKVHLPEKKRDELIMR